MEKGLALWEWSTDKLKKAPDDWLGSRAGFCPSPPTPPKPVLGEKSRDSGYPRDGGSGCRGSHVGGLTVFLRSSQCCLEGLFCLPRVALFSQKYCFSIHGSLGAPSFLPVCVLNPVIGRRQACCPSLAGPGDFWPSPWWRGSRALSGGKPVKYEPELAGGHVPTGCVDFCHRGRKWPVPWEKQKWEVEKVFHPWLWLPPRPSSLFTFPLLQLAEPTNLLFCCRGGKKKNLFLYPLMFSTWVLRITLVSNRWVGENVYFMCRWEPSKEVDASLTGWP